MEESMKKSSNNHEPKAVINNKAQKQREMEIQMKHLREQDQDMQVTQIIENHGQESQRINRQLNQALQDQEDNVKQRLQRRRMQSVRLRGQKD